MSVLTCQVHGLKASDAEEVRSLINKREFMAENLKKEDGCLRVTFGLSPHVIRFV
jgi:hypothetical protein